MITKSPVKIWRGQKQIRAQLGLTGKIVTYTVIRVPPAGFESQAPYPVVLVRTSSGMLVGQLVDYEKNHLKIGQNVVAVLRRVSVFGKEGVIPYGIKFKPL